MTIDTSPTAVAAAREALARAGAAEAAASQEVDRLREEKELGRATRGDIHAAQLRLGKAQEATEAAKARVRALEREAVRQRETEGASRLASARAGTVELRRERDEIERRIAEFLLEALRRLEELDTTVDAWEARAAATRGAVAGLGSQYAIDTGRLYKPSTYGPAYGAAVDGLRRLHSQYTR